jgi:hypothetical protein
MLRKKWLDQFEVSGYVVRVSMLIPHCDMPPKFRSISDVQCESCLCLITFSDHSVSVEGRAGRFSDELFLSHGTHGIHGIHDICGRKCGQCSSGHCALEDGSITGWVHQPHFSLCRRTRQKASPKGTKSEGVREGWAHRER